jgi:hypothetical protein
MLLSSAAIEERRPPGPLPAATAFAEPPDLAALYAASDGLVLADGTTILRRGELAAATAWLTQERALEWPEDLVVLGEREDLVIVLDLDTGGTRAGGGVLEAPTDGLESFRRIALSVVGYLERRAGIGEGDAAPEVLATEAAARKDAGALRAALARPMYPGSEREEAHAALVLGGLCAAAGDEEGAWAAFERAVAARVKAARRGEGELERAAAWRACAAVAREAGAIALAERCAARG